MKKVVEFIKDEYWYPCVVNDGYMFPLDFSSCYEMNFSFNNTYNQIAPILISSCGRIIVLKDGGLVVFNKGIIEIDAPKIFIKKSGTTLKDAQLLALKNCKCKFIPNEIAFKKPQLCTWIALGTNQTEKNILDYATEFIKKGFEPGILIIDDGWQKDNGSFEFDLNKIPNPKDLIDKLHNLGFKVSIWLCPYVSFTSSNLNYLVENDYLVKNDSGKIAIAEWFDENSYQIDFCNKKAYKWFSDQCNKFRKEYGIDGFKLDCGDEQYLKGKVKKANQINQKYVDCLTEKNNFSVLEARTVYKHNCQNVIQRLSDKCHCFEIEEGYSQLFGDYKKYGLLTLIPDYLLLSLFGYFYGCPDMAGGGNINDKKSDLNSELLIRWIQTSALLPMVQFSYPYWNSDDKDVCKATSNVMAIRNKFINLYVDLAKNAQKTHEPIVRYLEYEFPKQGFEKVTDMYMLGSDYLVVPLIKKDETKKHIKFPKGYEWVNILTNEVYVNEATIDTNLFSILIFERRLIK